MLLINKDKKIILGWTPKGGCTVGVKMFFNYIGVLEDAIKYSEWIHDYREQVYQPKHPIALEDLKNLDFLKIKIVRDPYKRVVSSFAHISLYSDFDPTYKDIQNTIHSAEPNNIHFMQYLQYLSMIDLNRTDGHQGYQKNVGLEGVFFNYDEIIKLENLDVELDRINQKYGLTLKSINEEKHSSSHHMIKDKNYNGPTPYLVKVRELIKKNEDGTRIMPDYKFFYNDNIREMVSRLYEEDIKEYGYDFTL